MNTLEVQELLMRDPLTEMVHVCAISDLEKPTQRPALYIVNTQQKNQRGKHWIALYFPEHGPVEYFDSLGRKPIYYDLNLENYIANKHRYQQAGTRTCGQYCYYYLYQRCVGRSIKDILNDFDVNDLDKNEDLVLDFVNMLDDTLLL